MRASLTLLMLSVTLGCGGAVDAASGRSVPPSDRDPLHFTPTPATEGHTDEPVALAAAGGEDQARRLLPALLVAVRDADERGLEQLLDTQVVSLLQNRSAAVRPREVVVQRLLLYARRSVIQPDVGVEELIELGSVQTSRAAQFFEGREMPEGLRATDVVLEVSVHDAARGALGAMFRWHARGAMVVRPGRDPRIVAF